MADLIKKRFILELTELPELALLYDAFNGSNGTALGSHPMDIGTGWTVHNGTISIESNQAHCGTFGVDDAMATADAGQSNAIMTVTLSAPGSGNQPGAVARFVDSGNYWLFTVHGSTLKIYEKTDGSFTERAAEAVSVSGEYVATVIVDGPNMSVTVNGVTATYSSSVHQGATRFGIRFDNTSAYADNFQVTQLA